MGLISELRRSIDSGDFTKAQEVALEIERRGYPSSLRKEATDFLRWHRHKCFSNKNEFSLRLYRQVTDLASTHVDSTHDWLPSEIICDSEDLAYPTAISNALEAYLEKYHLTGLHTLSYLDKITTKAIERAILPFFDYDCYISNHPDIASEGHSRALHHYAVFGGLEDTRVPNHLFANQDLFQAYPWTKQIRFNALYLLVKWPKQFPKIATLVAKRYSLTTEPVVFSWRQSQALSSPLEADGRSGEYRRILALTREASHSDRLIKTNKESLDIHFVIPDFTAGGGGHMTIFRLIMFLEKHGHRCTVWIKDYEHERHPDGPHASAVKFYQPIKALILPLSAHFAFAVGDALVATSWDTVEIVKSNKSFHDYFYLVQDYEPFFYARGSEAVEAEYTYTMDLKTICASSWLHDIMSLKHGRCSTYFDLSYDPLVYYSKELLSAAGGNSFSSVGTNDHDQRKPIIRLAFYARNRTARRAVSLGLKGLGLLKQENYTICVELFGETQGSVRLPANVIGHDNGILTPSELSELYRSCDIGLTFSATNYALVPQEMMACGLPVIEIDNESTRAIYPEDVIVLALPTAEGIASAIESLAVNPSRRIEIANRGLEWVQRTSWELSFCQVEEFFTKHVLASNRQKFCSASVQARYLSQTFEVIRESSNNIYNVSVVVPTYQGGELLQNVISAVQAQQGVDSYEIIIVDSSSTDNSIKNLEFLPNMSLVQIAQKDFQHGRTRNIGVALAKSPYVAFLTQDAVPANKHWLSNLVQPLRSNKDVDAVFGRHRAHPFHPAFLDDNLQKHFKSFDSHNNYHIHLDAKSYYGRSPLFRQFLHFYSDNNSCLRKVAWNLFPYHDVPYGEDQLWADWVILTGKIKAFAPDAVVYHSHHYTPKEEQDRSETESFFFVKYFGYRLGQSRLDIEIGIQNEARSILNSGDSHVSGQTSHLLDLIRAKREGYRRGCEKYDEFIESSLQSFSS